MTRLLLAALLLAGCTARATPACLERCAGMEIRDADKCQILCTSTCDRLHDTYGIGVETCREIQSAAPANPSRAP